jgi:hypothetical protein
MLSQRNFLVRHIRQHHIHPAWRGPWIAILTEAVSQQNSQPNLVFTELTDLLISAIRTTLLAVAAVLQTYLARSMSEAYLRPFSHLTVRARSPKYQRLRYQSRGRTQSTTMRSELFDERCETICSSQPISWASRGRLSRRPESHALYGRGIRESCRRPRPAGGDILRDHLDLNIDHEQPPKKLNQSWAGRAVRGMTWSLCRKVRRNVGGSSS